MVVISYGTIRDYTESSSEAVKDAFNNWYNAVDKCDWSNLNEIKEFFPSADYVGNDRYVFNIMGNHFRLIALIHFSTRTVYIRWLGTHAQYDKIKAKEV